MERCSWVEGDLCSACVDGWCHGAPPTEEALLLTAAQAQLVGAAIELHPEVVAVTVKRGEGFLLRLTGLDEEARATGLQWVIDGLALRRDTALEDLRAMRWFDDPKLPTTFGTALSDTDECGMTRIRL